MGHRTPTDDLVLNLLSNTVGSAPWYWRTFPAFERNGRQLEWRRNEPERGRSSSVLLHGGGSEDRILLAIAMYSRVFLLSPNLLGIWFEEGRRIRVFAIDPDSLVDFQMGDISVDGAQDYGGFTCAGGVLGEYWTSTDLEEGEHRIELSTAFAGLDRLLLIGSYARIRENACAAIFEIRSGSAPGSRRLAVYPQKWFGRDDFDLGYQWITRATRDLDSGRIVGDGIRITPFVLREDGCRIDRWITQDSRLPQGYS